MEKTMRILIETLVSNSEMIKNYKDCRDKAERFGKLFILKNNKPDAVLFSIKEYERVSKIVEYVEGLGEQEISELIDALPKPGMKPV